MPTANFGVRKHRRRAFSKSGCCRVQIECCEERIVLTPSLTLPVDPIDVSEDLDFGAEIVTFGFENADRILISAGDASGSFDVDLYPATATLNLMFPSAIDYESLPPSDPADANSDRLIQLTIRAEDLTTFEFVEGTLVLRVLDVDESPSFVAPPDDQFIEISEMADVSTEVVRIPLTDPQGDYLNLTVYEAAYDDNFNLSDVSTWTMSMTFFAYQDGEEAVLYLGSESLDYETLPTYVLVVVAEDDSMNADQVDFSVFIVDEPEWESTGIFVADRQVNNSAFFHTTIVIVPTDQDTWENDPRFSETVYIGRELYHYATLSAFPNGALGDGDLQSEIGWGQDAIFKLNSLGWVDLGGEDENAIINELFALDAAYDDALPYHLFPNAGEEKYNSNSYVRGLLDALTFNRPIVTFTAPLEEQLVPPNANSPFKYPGWNIPVPLSKFGIGT